MGQVFIARERYEFPNGAIGWRPGGAFDPVGPFAKVEKCPVRLNYGIYAVRRYTCYATAVADTFFSVPACTRIRGQHIRGFFVSNEDGVEFVCYDNQGET